jgi:hypothetical protein
MASIDLVFRPALLASVGWTIAACSGSSNTGSRTSTNIDCSSYSACALLTAADVHQAMGIDLGTGTESDTVVSWGEHDHCFYGGDGTRTLVALDLSCKPSGGFSADELQQSVQGLAGTVTDVPGIGDAALWRSAPAGTSGPSDLYVEIGGNIQFVISITPPSGSNTEDYTTAAEAMGTDVAGRL